METRFRTLTKGCPEDAKQLWQQAQHDVEVRYRFYEYMAHHNFEKQTPEAPEGAAEKRASSQEVSEEKPTTVGAGTGGIRESDDVIKLPDGRECHQAVLHAIAQRNLAPAATSSID